nr:retrotransposon protein, putative, Ty1-copia subclass [Tanacetum cinerariifolium]
MSSSSSHATVTYTSMSSDDDVPSWDIPLMDAYESNLEAPKAAPQSPDQASLFPTHALVYPEYLAPSDDDLDPSEAQPLPASISPTVLSSDYSTDFMPVKEDLEKDPEEDPKEKPSEEEEELSASVVSPPARLYIDLPSEGTDVGPISDPLPLSIDALVDSWVAAPTPPLPPPSPLSPLSYLLPRDGIYEIDMHNLYPNHCRLGHINKKHMEKLQRDGILQPTHDELLEKCMSCISGKMACKPFQHQVERAKELL